ncbi:MAG: hydroxymethylbilane synthase [Porphyromonadaceae bacterium]|nr:MAG: hydroxymethylbilane synthase [Porphyromonadaceae bacterium]
MKNKIIRIGTRGSELARYQADQVRLEIEKNFPGIEVEIVVIITQGDKNLEVSLSKMGDKGVFTKELEIAMLNNETDMAVHSLKDLPTSFPPGLKLGAVLKRAEVRDALVSKNGKTLSQLGPGDVIATSSLRRKSQLLAYNPDFNIIDIRGNVTTRLAKMDKGYCDAQIMAATALQRLGLDERITQIIDPDIMFPAVSQGAIGIEVREGDPLIDEIMTGINHEETMLITKAERAFLRSMEGGCQIPIGGYSIINGNDYHFTGFIADLNGKKSIKVSLSGRLEEAETITLAVSKQMMVAGATEILAEIRNAAGYIAD